MIGGLIRFLELYFGRSLTRVFCLLCWLQTCLRHAFYYANGTHKMASATSFKGTIGKALATATEQEIVPFQKVTTTADLEELPTETSSDQLYLVEACKVITSGVVPERFEKRKIAPLNLSRWITLASRVLRHYMSVIRPSLMLKLLVDFIVKVYA